MKHIVAFLFKFVITLVLLEIMLSLLTALNIWQICIIAAAVTVVSYLIGDLLILAFSNNIVATLSDAVLAFLTIYAFNYVVGYAPIPVVPAAISALVLAVGEVFFHKYMVRTIYPDRDKRRKST